MSMLTFRYRIKGSTMTTLPECSMIDDIHQLYQAMETIERQIQEAIRESPKSLPNYDALSRAYWQCEQRYKSLIRPSVRPATPHEYQAWLTGGLSVGGTVTHRYDYPMPADLYYVARQRLTLLPLHGSSAMYLIVPKGIEIDLLVGLGHSVLYYMDGFRLEGLGFVPAFTNILGHSQQKP
jgi:hypothetical protein